MSSGEVLKSGWCANRWSSRIKVNSKCCILNASSKNNQYAIARQDNDIPAGSFLMAACTYDEAWWPDYLGRFQVAHSSPSSLRLPLGHGLSKIISRCTVQVASGIEEGKLICSKMISGHYSTSPVESDKKVNKHCCRRALTCTTTANRRNLGIRVSAYTSIAEMWSKDTAACSLMRDIAFGLENGIRWVICMYSAYCALFIRIRR